jgi:anti-sigma factor RsiW
MKCLSESVLRAKIDGELSQEARFEVDRHLDLCEKCRRRLELVSEGAQRVHQALSSLDPDKTLARDPQAAFTAFQSAQDEVAQASKSFWKSLASVFSGHPVPAWGGAGLAALIVVLIVFAPARSLGQRILAMLRVQRVAVVPVSLNAMPGRNTMETVTRMLSDQVVVTLSPGKPQSVTSAPQAGQLAGFHVRTLTDQSQAPQISVQGEQAFVMTLSQDRLQEVLSALGRPDLQVPASINGSTIAVHIPKAVFIRYGDCPHHGTANGRQQPESSVALGCTGIAEVPSPIVSVPPGLNINQLAAVALQAAGMSAEQAEAFCQTVDWTSTLVVPIPTGLTSSMQVSVDGVEGSLITHTPRNGRPAGFDLIWVKNGIIYSIWGFGSPENALGLAGSLS